MEAAKILIGNEKIPEDELDKKFVEIFKTMCENEIPVYGFLNEGLGQWMVGPLDCFCEVFGKDYQIFRFDFEDHIAHTTNTFWASQLDPNPMHSKLLKYSKT